jgi:hypothetical protein
MKVKCPICGKHAEYEGNAFRPFCSERCKLIDLGKWIEEQYRIPTNEPATPERGEVSPIGGPEEPAAKGGPEANKEKKTLQ